ncbi:hypothetical protein [Alkalicoccus chagannorensis]|uniref:hypothetical protein n=1 Tax=Alkalicoccus chagannorensis TaxID=427072 RepID=UPI0003FCBFCE|nr:hypothetical protein [Alkalicoccus chagannorensis]
MKWILIAAGLVLTACSSRETLDEIEGHAAGPPDGYGRLFILIEDNVGGPYIREDTSRHPLRDFELEAYAASVRMDEEVSTGEESIRAAELAPNQKVRLELEEPIERKSTSLERYLTYQPRFIPGVEHARLEAEPYSTEELYTFYEPLQEEDYRILTTEAESAEWTLYFSSFREHLQERERLSVEFLEGQEQEVMDARFTLLTSNGPILETNDPEEIAGAFPNP